MVRGRPKIHVAPCSFCNRQFKRKEHLLRHERIHTQEKPFLCRCGSSFARKDLLARHEKQAHEENGDADSVVTDTLAPAEEGLEARRGSAEYPPPSKRRARGTGTSPDNTVTAAASVAVTDPALEAVIHPDANTNTNNIPPPRSAFDNGNGLQAGNDGLDWLWQSNPLASNSDFMALEFQPLLFDPDTFGLMNPLAAPMPGSSRVQPFGAPTAPEVEAPVDSGGVILDEEAVMNQGSSNQDMTRQTSMNHMGPGIDDDTVLGGGLDAPGDDGRRCPWRLSAEAYEHVRQRVSYQITMLSAPYSAFVLPKRHTLSRYLEGYIRGFHDHLPFLHLPTFSAAQLPEELFLALAAVGALYKFEHSKSLELFFVAKALVNLRQQEVVPRMKTTADSDCLHSPSAAAGGAAPAPITPGGDHSCETIPIIQTLNVLMAMASWGDSQLAPSALEMAGQLSTLMRLSRLSEPDPIRQDATWSEWIECEERRRTLLVSFTLLNLQFVAFNTPTPIMNQEIGLCLPHTGDMWRAATEAKWAQVRAASTHRERGFRETLRTLLAGRDINTPTGLSAFGNYVLMHGLTQQVLVDRQAASLRGGDGDGEVGMNDVVVTSLARALQCWQRCWSSTNESTLDPRSTHGPLAFNSTALLRIAYIRLVADLGPHRCVLIRNAASLAKSVARAPLPALQRSSFSDFAVGQCIGALSILVRSGVDYVCRTYSHTWSIIHSLSHIECACFLNLWLRSIASVVENQGAEGLRRDEWRLLGMMTSVLGETDHAEGLDMAQTDFSRIKQLAAACMRLWARVLGGEHVFQMVDIIAQALSLAAEMLELQAQSVATGHGDAYGRYPR